MNRFLIAAVFVLAAVTGLWAMKAGAGADPPAADRRPFTATIVVAGTLGANGVGELKAIRVSNPDKLSTLEAFFPDYRQRPTSNTAGGWMAGHHVYFDFPGGETIKVTVSKNGNARSWSTGRGDFKTNGDFNAFVAGLVTQK